MINEINPLLFDVAEWRLRGEREKAAFVPSGGDPSQGGGAPGGAPPGGADPTAMGMPPGMDPSAMAGGGGPPPAPAPAPAPAAAPAAAPAPGQPGAPAAGKPKIDPTFIYMELSRTRKILTHMLQHMGIELPPDILDDGSVAQVVQGQQPQSAPIGQEPQQPQQPQLPAMGGSGGIGPIQPPGGGGDGSTKQSNVVSLFSGPAPGSSSDFDVLARRVDALSALSRSLGKK